MKKGDVLSVAQLAAIMGAKQTSNLIPLCHPLMLTKVEVHCHLVDDESLAFTTDTHNKKLKLRLRLRQRGKPVWKWRHLRLFKWAFLRYMICARPLIKA